MLITCLCTTRYAILRQHAVSDHSNVIMSKQQTCYPNINVRYQTTILMYFNFCTLTYQHNNINKSGLFICCLHLSPQIVHIHNLGWKEGEGGGQGKRIPESNMKEGGARALLKHWRTDTPVTLKQTLHRSLWLQFIYFTQAEQLQNPPTPAK